MEKIQSKDKRTLISCFVIIVSHTRPPLPPHTPPLTGHCAPLLQHGGGSPRPRDHERTPCGYRSLLHGYDLPKRPRRIVASFMPPKRSDSLSTPKHPISEKKKRKNRRREEEDCLLSARRATGGLDPPRQRCGSSYEMKRLC